MRLLGYLMLACIALAAIRAAVAVLAVALLIALVWSAATRPRETAVLFGMVVVASLVQNHGLAFLGVALAAIAVAACRKRPPAQVGRPDHSQGDPKRLG